MSRWLAAGQRDRFPFPPVRLYDPTARAAIEDLHPGCRRDLEKPMAIAWSKVPHSLGIAARWLSG